MVKVFLVSFPALLVAVIFPGCVIPAATAAQQSTVYDNIGMDDVIFTNGLIFESPVRSRVDCSRRCSGRDGCVAFTYIKDPAARASGTCRGHFLGLTSWSLKEASAGDARTYQKARASAWLEKFCSSDSDCPGHMSVCFKWRCLCQLGLYYSESKDACRRFCSKSKLGNRFLEYQESSASLNGIYSMSDLRYVTRSECFAACVADPNCRSVDFFRDWQGTDCYLTDRYLSDNYDWDISNPYSAVYFRTCM